MNCTACTLIFLRFIIRALCFKRSISRALKTSVFDTAGLFFKVQFRKSRIADPLFSSNEILTAFFSPPFESSTRKANDSTAPRCGELPCVLAKGTHRLQRENNMKVLHKHSALRVAASCAVTEQQPAASSPWRSRQYSPVLFGYPDEWTVIDLVLNPKLNGKSWLLTHL